MWKGLGLGGRRVVTYRLVGKIPILVLGNINYLPVNVFKYMQWKEGLENSETEWSP